MPFRFPKYLNSKNDILLLSPTLICSGILIIQSAPRFENNVMTNMRQT